MSEVIFFPSSLFSSINLASFIWTINKNRPRIVHCGPPPGISFISRWRPLFAVAAADAKLKTKLQKTRGPRFHEICCSPLSIPKSSAISNCVFSISHLKVGSLPQIPTCWPRQSSILLRDRFEYENLIFSSHRELYWNCQNLKLNILPITFEHLIFI